MSQATAPIRNTDRFYIGGQWVAPSSDSTISVIDSDTEQVYFTVAEAQAADISRAVEAARNAFDNGPWPRLTHEQRAEYLRAIGAELSKRSDDLGQIWPRESGVLHAVAQYGGRGAQATFNAFAALAATYPFEEPVKPSAGQFGLLVREPVGVVGAIIPWNAPMGLISNKVAPALLAGCTVILKSSPEAPGEGYLMAEAAEAVGPAGRRAQRGHRRPRGLRAAGPRPPGRQDHLHRLHRGRPPDRLDLRRADRPLHPGARRQVGRRHPRRRRHRDHRPHPVPGRVLPVRPGLLLADPDRGPPVPARRAARGAGGHVQPGPRRRPVRLRQPDGAAGGRAAAGPGRGLHRQGHRRRRDARHRRRPPEGPRARLVHRADRVRQRRQPARSSPRRRSSARCCR